MLSYVFLYVHGLVTSLRFEVDLFISLSCSKLMSIVGRFVPLVKSTIVSLIGFIALVNISITNPEQPRIRGILGTNST